MNGKIGSVLSLTCTHTRQYGLLRFVVFEKKTNKIKFFFKKNAYSLYQNAKSDIIFVASIKTWFSNIY
jgi:hypothetical protein